MKNQTLLIDGSYLLKRSITGAKDTYTTKFGHIGGLYSFLTTIRSLIPKYNINKCVVMWDGEDGGIYRYLINKSYKSNRSSKRWGERIELSDRELEIEKEKERSILKQRTRIKQYLEELYIRQIEIFEIEGDDLIAEYVKRKHEYEDIYIFSNDQDLLQLLKYDNVKVILPSKNALVTKNNFTFLFNYSYDNILTIKILSGDNSDNIKGVSGIKLKTLLKHFPELEYKKVLVNDILKKSEKINNERELNKKKRLQSLDNIVNSKKILVENYKIMNLDNPILTDEAISELDDLDYPLSTSDRSSKILYNMMIEDGFLEVYGSSFSTYIKPFYSIIMNERN